MQYNGGLISEACSDRPQGLVGLGVYLAAHQTKFTPDVTLGIVLRHLHAYRLTR